MGQLVFSLTLQAKAMKEQTIVSILGLALILWWISTGKAKVKGIEEEVADIQKLAKPWVNASYAHSEKTHSRIYTHLRDFTRDSHSLLETVQDHFKQITKVELLETLSELLPEIAQEVVTFEKIMTQAKIQISEKDSYVDGPFELKTQAEFEPIDQIIIGMRTILRMTQEIGTDLMKQLGIKPEIIMDVNKPLNALLPL